MAIVGDALSAQKLSCSCRYFGSSAETEQEKRDFVELLRRRNEAFGAFVLGDYVPDYLTWITYKLQGVVPKFEATRDFGDSVTAKIFELENHRHSRARAQPGDVPDFVDVMLNAPLHDGKPMADPDIMLLLLVRISICKTLLQFS